MKIKMLTTGLLLFFGIASALGQGQAKTILFVCEHGSAKSIIAAAHFNKLAKKEGLNIQVVSRGINPDPSVPEAINNHLVADGFERHVGKPIQLTNADVENSDYVVAFNPIPEKYSRPKNLDRWNIPSFEAGYTVAKDSILTNIERIIDKIKADTQK